MAQLQAKTPKGLYKQIKPEVYVGRGSRVNAPRNQLPENGVSPLYHGNRVTYTKLYNGTKPQAQQAANEEGMPYGTHNPKKYYLRSDSPRKINPYPKSNVGPYGKVALPEQWKYKPEKTGSALADSMIDLDNRKLDLTNDVDSFFAKYPKKENESFEDYDERVYSPYANEYGTFLQNQALNDIYDRAIKKAYFGTHIDDDYERSYGPVDNDEKYQAYLKWMKHGDMLKK